MDYKTKATEFIKEYDIPRINLGRLYEIIKRQGYQIVLYNTYEPNEATELLLDELKLKEYSTINRAFSFAQGNIKIVFIDDTLLDKERLYALLHEEAHIYCGHMERYACSAANVEDEIEANEFVHYVLNPSAFNRIQLFIKKHKRQCVIALSAVLAIFILSMLIKQTLALYFDTSNKYSKTLEYYVTETGNKYHTRDCRFVKDKEFIRKITEEEFNSGLYEPCKECILNND